MLQLKNLRFVYAFLLFTTVVFWSSCRKDFNFEDSTGNLRFSKDTIYLDTIFSTIGSSTYALKVHNTSDSDVQIPTISLENGFTSKYRINVDGQAGFEFYNVPLLAKDSLYIFIETTVDISNAGQNEFLYTDAILIDKGVYEQKIPLITLVKDAVFLYPKKNANCTSETLVLEDNGNETPINGFELDENQLQFTNEKPYVVYGYAVIPKNQTLRINAGARVFFHKNSGIYVQNSSSVQINGALSEDQIVLENEVIFEGDRLEPQYSSVAGQWGAIWFSSQSINNVINHTTIKNATIGILVQGENSAIDTNLQISNSQIYNSSSTNFFAENAVVFAKNVVIANAGINAVNLNKGGKYSFIHATIANYWTSSFRAGNALRLDNSTSLIHAEFVNCIVDGTNYNELLIQNPTSTTLLNFSFTSSMLKINGANSASNTLYNVNNSDFYTSVYLNQEADFVNTAQNLFSINPNSFAIGKANMDAALQVPTDILGLDRSANPSIGAYQFKK